MQGNLAAYALCLSVLLYVCLAYKNGDRVSIMAQTLHNEWKTSLLELPLHQMPRFGEPAKFVYHATLPEPAISKEGSKGKGKVNPDQDIKISFTVSDNKILIPWTKIFDSKTKTSLTKLLVTFSHDQYEIIKADVESTCKSLSLSIFLSIVSLFILFLGVVTNSASPFLSTLSFHMYSWSRDPESGSGPSFVNWIRDRLSLEECRRDGLLHGCVRHVLADIIHICCVYCYDYV